MALRKNLTGAPFLLGVGKDTFPGATDRFGFRSCVIVNVYRLPKENPPAQTGHVGHRPKPPHRSRVRRGEEGDRSPRWLATTPMPRPPDTSSMATDGPQTLWIQGLP